MNVLALNKKVSSESLFELDMKECQNILEALEDKIFECRMMMDKLCKAQKEIVWHFKIQSGES